MMKCYPEFKEREEMRKIIGRYGLTGKQQVTTETTTRRWSRTSRRRTPEWSPNRLVFGNYYSIIN